MSLLVTAVPKHGEEFVRIEHLLQLSLRTATLRDVSIWSISNPALTSAHEKSAGASLVLDSWVDISSLGAANAVQDVCRRGFVTPTADVSSGLPFNVGAITLPSKPPQNGAPHQFLLCSIALGRSYVADGTSGAPEKRPPPGFDSLYVHTPSLSQQQQNEQQQSNDSSAYSHRYVVFDAAAVLPRYIIHFAAEQPAPTLIPRRRAGDINLADIKARISEALSALGPAASAATDKMLSDIGSAYEEALVASRTPDALLDARRASIRDALSSIDSSLAAIQANSAAVEEALYAAMQRAMFALQDETQKKMNVLLSSELELRRQLGEMDALDAHVRYAADALPPMSFISAWERSSAHRRSLYPTLGGPVPTRLLPSVAADILLEGEVRVTTAGAAKTSSNAAAAAAATSLEHVKGGGGGASANPPEAVSEFWNAVLRSSMGLAPMPHGASVGSGSVPVFTLEQAHAELARARADLSAVTAASGTLAPELAAQGEAARAQAAARVADATSLVTIHTRRELSVDMVAHAHARAGTVPSSTPAAAPIVAAPAPPPPPPALPPATPAHPPVALSPSLLAKLARFSIAREAERRLRARGAGAAEASEAARGAFSGSTLLPRDAAASLFMCLPWGSGVGGGPEETAVALGAAPPVTQLITSARGGDAGAVNGVLSAYFNSQAAGAATVIIARAGAHVFGGFAADSWDGADLYGGSTRCFVFSVSHDAKLPFTGRVRGPRQSNDDALRAQHEMANAQATAEFDALLVQARELHGGGEPDFDEAGRLRLVQTDASGQVFVTPIPVPRPRPWTRHDALRSNAETMAFGVGDFVLSGDLSACTSELEHSYGVGLRPDEARTLLTGSSTFSVDALELWAVLPHY